LINSKTITALIIFNGRLYYYEETSHSLISPVFVSISSWVLIK